MRSAAATPTLDEWKKWFMKAFCGSSAAPAYASAPLAISTRSGYSLRRSRSASACLARTACSSRRASGRP